MSATYKHGQEEFPTEPSIQSLRTPSPMPRSPLHWWRTLRPEDFGRSDVRAIRAILLRTSISAELDWLRAVTGDPATAIGIAVRQLNAYGMTCPIIDVALSAVLCCAIEGDGASQSVVESALRRRHNLDPSCAELIVSWRAARF